jgi:hypothetical protein
MNAGFYKCDQGTLLPAPEMVAGPGYTLFVETRTEHTYPVDGWYWFDNEESARKFWDLPAPEVHDADVLPDNV